MKNITKTITAMAICVAFNSKATDGFILQPKSVEFKSNDFSAPKQTKDTEEGIKGKIIITAGIGLNASYLNFYRAYAVSDYATNFTDNNFRVRSIPMINVMADYGIGKKVSVGLSFGYQTTNVSWEYRDYSYNNSTGNYNNFTEIITDKWTRFHFAARGDYRIIAKENLGLYTGLKLGYNTYTLNSTTATKYYSGYKESLDLHFSPVSVQAHFGFSYWFQGMFGVNAEVGIGVGGPYIGAIGATFKL
jgi:hypothetical protein